MNIEDGIADRCRCDDAIVRHDAVVRHDAIDMRHDAVHEAIDMRHEAIDVVRHDAIHEAIDMRHEAIHDAIDVGAKQVPPSRGVI
jgi:hypothetical protein